MLKLLKNLSLVVHALDSIFIDNPLLDHLLDGVDLPSLPQNALPNLKRLIFSPSHSISEQRSKPSSWLQKDPF